MFIRRIIYQFLERQHYWRYVDFGELAELYATRMMRTMAVSMVSGLLAIYLYRLGYTLVFISLYFMAYFVVRALLMWPTALLIARIGPKHTILISNLLFVPALGALTTVGEFGIAALCVTGLLQATSVTLYVVAHLVDFSKVKHSEHAGKELGFMNMIDRIATSLSPLLGGVIAYLFGPHATMWAAAILFAIAAVPLFFTAEPTRTRQILTLRGFNWRKALPGMVAEIGCGVDFVVSSSLWTLFVAISILGVSTNAVYAKVGALATVTLLSSLVFSRLFGVLIDRRRGGELLRASVVGNSILHLARPFIGSISGVAIVNVVNESVTTGYAMPFMRGMFDVADDLPGYRIVYVTIMEAVLALSAACTYGVIALLVAGFGDIDGMKLGFVFCAIATLTIALHRFPALATRR